MPDFRKPKLVNRGPAGLLTKTSAAPQEAGKITIERVDRSSQKINKISQSLRDAGLVHSITEFSLDPENARLHPERNMEAIKDSLAKYGQVKPIVVRGETNTIIAGNGTYTASIALGWTEIAATIVEMSYVEAAGYGLADNRTAELAKWDFEVVARLDKLLLEASEPSIGWTKDELEVLRVADWTPPPISDDPGEGGGSHEAKLVLGFTPDQYEPVKAAIAMFKKALPKITDEEALSEICKEWLKG